MNKVEHLGEDLQVQDKMASFYFRCGDTGPAGQDTGNIPTRWEVRFGTFRSLPNHATPPSNKPHTGV